MNQLVRDIPIDDDARRDLQGSCFTRRMLPRPAFTSDLRRLDSVVFFRRHSPSFGGIPSAEGDSRLVAPRLRNLAWKP